VQVRSRPNLLASPGGRRALFAALYVSEGAPIGFVWWAMPSLLREQGVALASITTLTALATLPWVLKFLAAPLVDASLRLGVLLKHWILVCQLTMAAVLVPMLWLDWRVEFDLLLVVIVTHSIFAAVQDVAIDTLAIQSVPSSELGRVNGWMQAGMLGGRAAVAAGSALIAAAFGTPAVAVVIVIALIGAPALLLVAVATEPRVQRPRFELRSLLPHIRAPSMLYGLAIALLIGAGFEFFGVSVGPRLIDEGRSGTALALFYGLMAPAGLAVGALLGGALADRRGVVKATAMSLAALTALLLMVAVGQMTGGLAGVSLPLSMSVYLAIGALTASCYALFMTLSQGEFSATRFSLLMAMTNACEAWAGFVGGRFAAQNFGLTLLALTVVACVAVWPLYALSRGHQKGVLDGSTTITI
jgi:MFS transporter, PAT family, beta-lactamase induction signal transducer AmpG